MSEHVHKGLDELRESILSGDMSRRQVLKRAVALGLSAPTIAVLLAACGGDDDDDATATEDSGSGQEATEVATEAEGDATEMATEDVGETTEAATEAEEDATEMATEAEGEATTETGSAGGGGRLNILNWQAASILNPHLAQGGKDFDASRIYAEPLADFDGEGNLVPFLATEIPSFENGLLAADGTSVTWTLKEGVTWHDGTPFTASDCVFTWQLVVDPEAATTTKSQFEAVESMEAIDDYTLLITFNAPTPAWFDPFTSAQSLVVPQHLLEDWTGAKLNDAPFNLAPVGTGPYKVTEFKPQDTVLYDRNESYHVAGLPFFDTAEYKGGGDATSAARAVLETGDVDYAENLQVEAQILLQMEATGIGRIITSDGNSVERILLNRTDPNIEIDGERSHLSTQHPALSELEFRQALTYLTDRETIATQLYGPAGKATSNILPGPPRFDSPNTSFEFNIEKAAEMLDAAGWELVDGVRTKGDYSVSFLYQTSTNSVRQKTQEIVKQAFEEVGLPVELKAVDAGVFFSSDPGNPDTYTHFYADIEMFTNNGTVYPVRLMGFYKSNVPEEDIPTMANEWSGRNINRFIGTPAADEYNELWLAANTELDAEAQNELFIGMNDILVNDVVEIPLIHRTSTTAGANNKLQGIKPTAWVSEFWDVRDWYKEE